jgi:phosphotransferase system  glucose/maltose/N-acetylglucosamine-specific IIC component
MDVVIALAVAVTLRLGVRFFGQLAAQGWGKAIIAFTTPLVIPFGVHAIKTPYGGVFDVNAALTVCVFLLAEWVLSGIRNRA